MSLKERGSGRERRISREWESKQSWLEGGVIEKEGTSVDGKDGGGGVTDYTEIAEEVQTNQWSQSFSSNL